MLRTRHNDVVGDSSERSYVTEQGHNVPLLRTRGIEYIIMSLGRVNISGHWPPYEMIYDYGAQ